MDYLVEALEVAVIGYLIWRVHRPVQRPPEIHDIARAIVRAKLGPGRARLRARLEERRLKREAQS